jgi:hypothetical protein
LKPYFAAWVAASIVAGSLMLRHPSSYALFNGMYWRAFLTPWKLATFCVATTGITLIAPYTGDPTWDYFDALFMSVLAFTTAPWTVGALYRVVQRKLAAQQGFVAFCVWMFSASWSYDLYLLVRDGFYPVTWLANLFASSLLYLSAGLFWSLQWTWETGITFAFTDPDWPQHPIDSPFGRIFWAALLFMGLVSAMILPLLWRSAG